VSDSYTQGRLQEIERHVRSLDGTVRVLAAVDRPAVRKGMEATFSDPRLIIIFRGVQRGLTQQKIADELKARGLPRAQQGFVSTALTQLLDRGFVDRAPKGGYSAVEGWEAFGLNRILRKILKANNVDDIA
jgi:hypothetical protein